MRFRLEESHNHAGRIISIRDTVTSASASILPDRGARLDRLDLPFSNSLRSLIDGLCGAIDDPWYKNALLIPFPSRLPGGSFEWNNRHYVLPCNVPDSRIALHGFFADRPFRITSTCSTDTSMSLLTCSSYSGDIEGFPFPFDVILTDTLDTDPSFTRTITIINRSHIPIPMMAGWHPYVSLNTSVNGLVLGVPSTERMELDARMLPTGRTIDTRWFDSGAPIGLRSLNDGFRMPCSTIPFSVSLSDPASGLHLRIGIDRGPGQFRIVHLFTPPSRTSISIEPLTGYGFGLNTGLDRLILEPNASFSASYRITLTSIVSGRTESSLD